MPCFGGMNAPPVASIVSTWRRRPAPARFDSSPKPMIPVGGRPLLEHQVLLARKHGFHDIRIFACYRADLIERHFGEGSRWNVQIAYVVESEPLGTAGAVLAGFDGLAENFLVLN